MFLLSLPPKIFKDRNETLITIPLLSFPLTKSSHSFQLLIISLRIITLVESGMIKIKIQLICEQLRRSLSQMQNTFSLLLIK